MSNASSIAVDWGTSNLRIWVLDHNGDILKELKSDEGMGTLSPDQFEPCLIRHIEPWLGDEVLPVVICGMAGARQGWKEAPYSEAPCAALPSVVDVPTNDKRIKVAIAAGVKQMDPADIMRGEETQIAGFLADHSDFEGVVVLPGTHSKWVEIKSGKITRFQTMMTGESFALYSRQSILRFSMNGWNEADFLANIKKVFAEPERAVSHLFSIRARDILLGDKTGESALSGILIGTELAAIADLWRAQNVAIIGVGSLASAYFQALKSLGADCAQFDGSEMSLKRLEANHEGNPMNRQLIAILRGITPDEITDFAQVLVDAGITMIEVPLNSPDAFTSIEKLVKNFGDRALCGAGTVLQTSEVEHLHSLGAQMIVSPNCDQKVIEKTKALGMTSYPGVMTPSEAFAALAAGADGLKFFPGELVGPTGLKAIRAVLPQYVSCFAVGGAKADNFADWKAAGANGFGIGSALYKSGLSLEDCQKNATEIVAAYDKVM